MISTITITLVFFTVLIIGHEAGHFLTAKFFGLKVHEFGFGFPPKLLSRIIKGTKYSLNLIPFGGFVRIHGENLTDIMDVSDRTNFQNLFWIKKVVIIASGVFVNLVMGYLAISLVFFIGITQSLFVTDVMENSPAKIAGFLPQDKILDFKTNSDFVNFLKNNEGKEILISVIRSGQEINLKANPRTNPKEGEGRLGVILTEDGIAKSSIPESLVMGAQASFNIILKIIETFINLFTGIFSANLDILNKVSGPVGVVGALGEANSLGLVYLLQLFGLISLNLAVLNFLPIPALDGGRLLFIVIEKITRKKIDLKVESVFHIVGFLILIALMTIITAHDIIKIL